MVLEILLEVHQLLTHMDLLVHSHSLTCTVKPPPHSPRKSPRQLQVSLLALPRRGHNKYIKWKTRAQELHVAMLGMQDDLHTS